MARKKRDPLTDATADQYRPMLGLTFTRHLTTDTPLRIGVDTYSRLALARLGIVQTKAASILSAVATDLGVKSVRDLFAHSSPYTFADYPAGLTTMYVLFRVFESQGLSVQDWYLAGKDAALRNFAHLKKRELLARLNERKAARRRSRQMSTTKTGELLQ